MSMWDKIKEKIGFEDAPRAGKVLMLMGAALIVVIVISTFS